MSDLSTICAKLKELADKKYGTSRRPAVSLEVALAVYLLGHLEDVITHAAHIPVQEFTLDVDYENELNAYDETGMEDLDGEESFSSQKSSQEWESIEVGSESFTLDQAKKIVEFYETRKSNKFQQTQRRYPRVLYPNYIARFKAHILANGTKGEKLSLVNQHVWSKFMDARDKFLPVSDKDLQRWGIRRARDLTFPNFVASEQWVANFKESNRVVSRKITKFVCKPTPSSAAENEEATKKFLSCASLAMENYPSKNIFNVDQSGFNYEIAPKRTLALKGEKTTFGAVKSTSATTHSYSIMPMISMDGYLKGKLLVCLQETDGKFGPRVDETIRRSLPPNIYLTCSKSGKLTKALMEEWVKNCLEPTVTEDFILLLDSWSGQTDDCIFSSLSKNFQRLQIPPKATDKHQPLDVYFFRQYKVFVKKIFRAGYLDFPEIDLKNRVNLLRMHSLVFNQLQSPVFRPMLKYAWFASGYTTSRAGDFLNVTDLLFDFREDQCDEFQCEQETFICCSYCKSHLCFTHFFVGNHFHSN